MKKLLCIMAMAAAMCVGCGKKGITPVSFTDVHIEDSFWRQRLDTLRNKTIRYAFKRSDEAGYIRNFAIAAGMMEGRFQSGQPFDDAEVFKIIEGASYLLKVEKDGNSVNKKFIKTECMSTISVMGLVTNKDTTALYGPGILQLCIYSHATNEAGEVKTKTMYSKIRLYETIDNANLLIRNELGKIVQNPGTYDELPRTDTLRVDGSRLRIIRDEILNTSDDDNPVDNWGPEGDGDDNKLDIEL